jgi:hypothetical protein
MIYLNLPEEPASFMDVLNVLYDKTKGDYSLVPTYYDKECTQEECEEGKRRSFQALFEIAQTYFPSITMDEFERCLHEKKLNFYLCSDIGKLVFHYVTYTPYTDFKEVIVKLRNDYKSHPNYLDIVDKLQNFYDENA